MIYIRKEGDTIRNGFNFYPLSDLFSAGCKIRLGRFILSFRYRKHRKDWIIDKRILGKYKVKGGWWGDDIAYFNTKEEAFLHWIRS